MKEKTIGILGGMGPEATLLLFQKIIANTEARRDQDHAHVIIYNNPKIPERLPAIHGTGMSPVPMMLQGLKALKAAGANFVVIPCVTAHFFLPELIKSQTLPILSIITETVFYIKENYPQIKSVGLMGALGTIHTGLFQKELEKNNINYLISNKIDCINIQKSIFAIKDLGSLAARKKMKKELVTIGQKLLHKGAQGIILGCTELPIILSAKDFSIPVFDVLDILAQAALKEAGLR